MPRQPRVQEPGGTYHVTARGNDGTPIFRDDFDRMHLLDLFSRAVEQFDWICFAYCLMGNHYHLLVHTPDASLSSGMHLIQTRHARRFNIRHGRRGHLFGSRFHDRGVRGESHLLAAAVYTVQNPVRAGLVAKAEDWQWSSFRATAGLDAPAGFLDEGSLLRILSPDRARARVLFREMVASPPVGESAVPVTAR